MMRFLLKSFLSVLITAFFAHAIYAKPVDENLAEKVAANFYSVSAAGKHAKNEVKFTLAYACQSNVAQNSRTLPITYYYIFNAGLNDGFVIVAGDDAVSPILGYSTTGTYSNENLAPNFRKWMEDYKDQIRYVIENKIPATERIDKDWEDLSKGSHQKKGITSVDPLLKTQWNQSPYYNDLCPYDNTASERTVTGCVATAMAQIMKYWNYPEQGSGFFSYNHDKYGTISASFSGTTYDWSNMPHKVNTTNNAVATLMYHCGVSAQMNYGIASTGGSGAYVISSASEYTNCTEYALKEYFAYDDNLKGISQNDYTAAEWVNILKDELDNGRPIMYAGYGGGGGHAFVCDGYDNNNYFHFNWGWGGAYDGYFAIGALNPGGVGTGGGTGGYNSNHQAIIGVKPKNGGGGGGGGNSADLVLYDYINLSSTSIYYGQSFTVNTDIINSGTNTFTGDYTAALFDKDMNFVDYIQTYTNQNLPSGYHYNGGITFSSSGMLSALPGNYYVGIFFKPTDGNWIQVANSGGYTNMVSLKVINPNDVELYSAINVTTGTTLTIGKTVTVNVDVANFASTSFSGTIDVSLYNLDGSFASTIETKTNMSLCANCHYNNGLTFSTNNLNIAKPGTYLLAVLYKPTTGSWQLVGSTDFTNPIKVIVQEAPILPDNYEQNNIPDDAYSIPINFSNNAGSFKTSNANIHIGTDYDYYKVDLAPGYNYSVTARVHDKENSTSGAFTNDVLFSYYVSTWSDAYDDVLPGPIQITDGGTVYFHVAPYFQGETGTYMLDVKITRSGGGNVGVEDQISEENKINLYPNPVRDVLYLETENSVKLVTITDVNGKKLITLTPGNLQGAIISVPVQSLQQGLYFIEIQHWEGIKISKFIKAD